MNKTERVIMLLRQDRFSDALAIAVRFHFGFTKEEKRILEIAHESLSGHSIFYRNIGIDVGNCIDRAKEIIRNKYNL